MSEGDGDPWTRLPLAVIVALQAVDEGPRRHRVLMTSGGEPCTLVLTALQHDEATDPCAGALRAAGFAYDPPPPRRAPGSQGRDDDEPEITHAQWVWTRR